MLSATTADGTAAVGAAGGRVARRHAAVGFQPRSGGGGGPLTRCPPVATVGRQRVVAPLPPRSLVRILMHQKRHDVVVSQRPPSITDTRPADGSC